ncbi:MAG: copper chaperone PCu(A)C [Pseudomonadota bacterium]
MQSFKTSAALAVASLALLGGSFTLSMSAALADPHQEGMHHGPAQIESTRFAVQNAWARINPAPNRPSAIYFDLANHGASGKLTGATTPIAKRTELHNHEMKDGVMRMVRIEAIDIPAKKTLEFALGGYHVMLFGLENPPKPGAVFPLSLEFADGTKVDVKVTAQDITYVPEGNDHGGHGAHEGDDNGAGPGQ